MSARSLFTLAEPRALYALAADLQGFRVRAFVYRHMPNTYGYRVTLDGMMSPARRQNTSVFTGGGPAG
jgi:hypothetical protein